MLSHEIVSPARRDAGAPAGTARNGAPAESVPVRGVAGQQQYAVVLLNEDQMAQLLQRPPVRQVNPPLLPPGTAYDRYTRMMRRARVGLAALGVLIAGASAWAWVPRPVLSALPWARSAVAPTVSTGASFSVTVASPRGADAAAAMTSRLMAIGVPAFARPVPNKELHQVMVGPYVSLDEAEAQQKRLAQRGYGSTRLFVDESLRHAPRTGEMAAADANPALVLVGAPGRLALALEMRSEPRRVNATRVDDNTLDLEIGPIDGVIDAQQWSAPEGAHLVRRVAVEEVAGAGAVKYARARLDVPEFAHVNTRVEGRRVYIDLTWPQEAVPSSAAAASAIAAAPPAAVPAAAAPAVVPASATAAPRPAASAQSPAVPVVSASNRTDAGPSRTAPPAAAPAAAQPGEAGTNAGQASVDAALANAIERLERALPFVQSAAKSPAPDVFAALTPTVAGIEASLRQITASGEKNAARGLLLSATASARRVIDPDFLGSRPAESQQAAGLLDAAKALVPPTTGR